MFAFALPCLAQSNPFDPLSEAEIGAATAIVSASRGFPQGALFPVVALHEPTKAMVFARANSIASGAKAPLHLAREADVVILDRAANRMIETVVDLDAKKIVEWKPLPGRQPLVLLEEYETVPAIVKADAGWQAAMRRRGIDDFSKIWVDTWATGSFAPAGQEGARLLRAVSYFQDGAVNFYGRPIEGVTAVVNLNSRKVVELVDTQAYPVPPERLELDPPPADIRGLKPLTIVQPDGPSFSIDGQQVAWQGWTLRWAMHPREGLVLYDVGFDDPFDASPAPRRVLYRAALSEMVVPYGDTDAHWVWRNAFDEGEYGVGRLASPIDPAVDAPPNARLFDATFADDFGKPYTLPRAVGLYERDAGLLWKHYDIYHEKNSARRARQLVLFFIATIGNYDYAIQWVFHQDGTVEVTCDLTGIMLVQGAAELAVAGAPIHVEREAGEHETGPAHAHRVAPNLVAPHHQHFFNFRLDFDVDGVLNSVSEHNTSAAAAGPDNPANNGIDMRDIVLTKESVAQRDVQMSSARAWRIGDGARRNALGYAPSFLLVPTGNAVPYLSPESTVRKRARFVDHHFWATRYHEGERHAAGWYPNQGPPGEGLPEYVADDESLVQEDVVVWYTVGITHVPRPEEWPIMSVHQVGFKLLPAGFFVRNPSFVMPVQ
jgi:primary-amine oxidase